MTLVKICGNTNTEDVRVAIDAGADFIGLIFASSKRQISPEVGHGIVSHFPNFRNFVGVFVNEKFERIVKTASLLKLKWLQLHGDEPEDLSSSLMKLNYQVIKAFRIRDMGSISTIQNYPANYYLLDSYKDGQYGGTGVTIDRSFLANDPTVMKKSFLAGGLNPQNVGETVQHFHPYAVDAVSGVERSAGLKNHEFIKQFVRNAKEISVA